MRIRALHIILAVFTLLILQNCYQNKFQVEDVMLSCMVESFESVEVDIHQEIKLFERFLIEEEWLKDSTAASYVMLMNQTLENGSSPIVVPDYRFEKLLSLGPNEMFPDECADRLSLLPASVLESSSFTQIVLALDQLKAHDSIGPMEVLSVWSTIIGEEEFEHSYYRYSLLLSLHFISDQEGALDAIPSQPVGSEEE